MVSPLRTFFTEQIVNFPDAFINRHADPALFLNHQCVIRYRDHGLRRHPDLRPGNAELGGVHSDFRIAFLAGPDRITGIQRHAFTGPDPLFRIGPFDGHSAADKGQRAGQL